MYLSVLSLVMAVVVLTAAAAVGCYCWLAARHHDRVRGGRDAEWARLRPALRDVDEDLDWLWEAESARIGRSR